MLLGLRLRFWKDTQLARKDAELNARIDSLGIERRKLEDELSEVQQKISLIKLRIQQSAQVGDDEADLMELQLREMEIKQEIATFGPRIETLEKKLEPYVHERDRRRQKEYDKLTREERRIRRRIDRL